MSTENDSTVEEKDISMADLERLAAFKGAIVRCRWFMLVTTLISCLIVSHTYLQQFSYQDAQLRKTLLTRYEKLNEEASAKPEDQSSGTIDEGLALGEEYGLQELKERFEKTDDPNSEGHERRLMESFYNRIITNNTLRSVHMQDRDLLFLGLAVPSNDYAEIMTAVLLIFVVGLWLNIRSLGAIMTIEVGFNNRTLFELILLNFTFTGLFSEEKDARLAKVIQSVAFWIPFWCLATAQTIDFINPIKALLDGSGLNVAGEPSFMLRKFIFSVVSLGLILSFTKSSAAMANSVDTYLDRTQRRI